MNLKERQNQTLIALLGGPGSGGAREGAGRRPGGVAHGGKTGRDRGKEDIHNAKQLDNHGAHIESGGSLNKVPTAYLKVLHHFNMGQSGAGKHKDIPRIEKELARRGERSRPSMKEIRDAASKIGLGHLID